MSRRPPPRVIFFDAGNTLIRMDEEAILGVLAAHGVRTTAAEWARAEWRARVRLDAEVLAPHASAASTESGEVGDRYLEFVLAGLGVHDPETVAVLAAWRRGYNRPVGLWNAREPAAEPALALARRAGVRTAVISNSNGSVRAILQSVGLAGYLDFVIDSAEIGVEKPDPRIFRLALERARVTAADAAYVGDLYSVDVLGARAVGLEAVLLDPGGCWGARDCPTAPDVLAAVTFLLG